MTESGTREGKPADPVSEAMSAVTRMQAATLGPLNWMGPASMDAFQATLREMSHFVSERLEKDLETQKALLDCRSLEDVQSVQSEAVRQAFEDYRAEAERLSEIARQFLEQSTRQAEGDGSA